MSMVFVGANASWIVPSVIGAGTAIYGANKASQQQGTAPPPRDLGAEFNTMQGALPGFGYNAYNNSATYNPQYTNLNLGNYNTAVGGVAGGMQGYWQQANPGLASYTGGLQQYLNNVTANTPGGVGATGYDASQSAGTTAGPAGQSGTGGPGYNPIYAQNVGTNFGFSRVNPNTGFNAIGAQGNDYGLNMATSRLGSTGPSPIQQDLEGQAYNDLQLGGALTDQEARTAQQTAREGWASRGLINSNGAVADEVLNTDAMALQRQNQRRAFAQGVDQTGFGQRQQGFTNALGVSDASRGYAGLGLSAAQSNLQAQLAGNQLGYQGQLANQQAGLQTNAQRLQGQMANQAAGLQAGAANQGSGLGYANLATNNNQYNTGQYNNMAQFNANLGQQNNQFNATANNNAQQYNVGAVNNMNQFNQGLAFQGNQNAWNNAMQYGQLQNSQAQNPFSLGMGLMGTAPDYTGAILGYGNDVYNTNYNGQAAANISSGNNGAALAGAGFGLMGNAAGAYLRYGQPQYGYGSPYSNMNSSGYYNGNSGGYTGGYNGGYS